MPYDTIKNGLDALLQGVGFQECESVDFESAATGEFEDTFILTCEDGEADPSNEQQAAFLYDNQKWTVQIAFGKGSNSAVLQRDEVSRKKDDLLTQLDDPANWRGFCTLLRYKAWSITNKDSYFVLKIELKVKDALTY